MLREDKLEVKKGNIWEMIVEDYLEKEGYVIYQPKKWWPHAFDRLAIKDKQVLILAEVKTKGKMTSLPFNNATGFEYRHYTEYKRISEKYILDIFIFFVDDKAASVYGNYLSELNKPYRIEGVTYPVFAKWLALFHTDSMLPIRDLTENEVTLLKEYTKK